jgi:autotransporter-associated beta strand protein
MFTSTAGLSPNEIRFKAYDTANGGGNLLYDFTAGSPVAGTRYAVPAVINNFYTTSSATMDINSGSTTTYNSVFSGIGSIVKDGLGTLVLSGANTHTQGTIVKTGILDVPVVNSIASGTVVVQPGGTLKASNAASSTVLTLNSSLILSGGAIQIG